MHPVKKIIENDLKITTSEFARQVNKRQSTVSSFYSRQTKVDNLPVWVISGLSALSDKTTDEVIDLLKKSEENQRMFLEKEQLNEN